MVALQESFMSLHNNQVNDASVLKTANILLQRYLGGGRFGAASSCSMGAVVAYPLYNFRRVAVPKGLGKDIASDLQRPAGWFILDRWRRQY